MIFQSKVRSYGYFSCCANFVVKKRQIALGSTTVSTGGITLLVERTGA